MTEHLPEYIQTLQVQLNEVKERIKNLTAIIQTTDDKFTNENKAFNTALNDIDEATYRCVEFVDQINDKVKTKLKEFEDSIQKLVLNQTNLTNSIILISSQFHDLENRIITKLNKE